MKVGFDTEYAFRTVRTIGRQMAPDVTTAYPVCACLAFEDGRELTFTEGWDRLGDILNDDGCEVVVHGAHAEQFFCSLVGIRFPERYTDTLLAGVMLSHATTFEPPGGAYRQAGLATIAPRFGIPFLGADDKDAIRDSIMHGRHMAEFGMPAVTAMGSGSGRSSG